VENTSLMNRGTVVNHVKPILIFLKVPNSTARFVNQLKLFPLISIILRNIRLYQ
jgi:hypothetical protein